jgi:hypothetical protein
MIGKLEPHHSVSGKERIPLLIAELTIFCRRPPARIKNSGDSGSSTMKDFTSDTIYYSLIVFSHLG